MATLGRSLVGLRRRMQFLAVARGRSVGTRGMVVQGLDRADQSSAIGVGFTCSRKVGNAVQRNRAKRRLRAVANDILPSRGYPGWDYVLIGRAQVTVTREYEALASDLTVALCKLHGKGQP